MTGTGVLNWSGGDVFNPIPNNVNEAAVVAFHESLLPKLYANVTIGGLTIRPMAYLDQNGKNLILNPGSGGNIGRTNIQNMGSLIIRSGGFIDTESLTVAGHLDNYNGLVQVDTNAAVTTSGILGGYGRVQMAGNSSHCLTNNGYIVGDLDGRLRIFGTAGFDWDGDGNEPGGLKVHHDSELRIEIPHSDPFDGNLQLDDGAIFYPTQDWELQTGTVFMRGGTIRGGTMHVSNPDATINANASNGDAQCDLNTELVMDAGALNIDDYCTLNLAYPATILADANIQLGPGSALVVTEGQIQGSMVGTGGLTKSGEGTFQLLGSCEYTGETIVEGGQLELSNLGGSLVGRCGIVRLVDDQSAGSIEGDLILDAEATLELEIRSQADYDFFSVLGSADFNGSVKIITAGYQPMLGDVFQLLVASEIVGTPCLELTEAVLPGRIRLGHQSIYR